MAEAGLQKVETYVSCRQNTVAKYIAARTIMDLCLEDKRRTGPRVAMQWQEKESLDLEGIHTADQEAEWTEGQEEETDGTETATKDQ